MKFVPQVIATLLCGANEVGRVVAFNCTGTNLDSDQPETPMAQAERYKATFERDGNAMVQKVAEVLGADRVRYTVVDDVMIFVGL
ncbi:hypothetical protein [Paraburkholderia sp. GAS32]|uniref:hypothetical protein n=1 Tax=Paraburkholderia sp. GAS32 TaxID=3035129 RepID=UPI003D1D2B32